MNAFKQLVCAVSASLAIFVSACATGTTKPTIDSVAARINIAAETTTSILIEDKPEWKPKLVAAADALDMLALKDTVAIEDIVAVIEKLGVKELGSKEAKIALASGKIIFYDYVSGVEVQFSGDVKKIALAISTGIKAGL